MGVYPILNFIRNESINDNIGLDKFKWSVENIFCKYFNQKIKVENSKIHLSVIRKEMT